MSKIILQRKSTEKPVISIISITYNHEKYIRQCLESFLMQRVDYPIEIIVHDDASTDQTARILEEFYYKYPNLFTVIIDTENQYSQNKPFLTPLYEWAQGKYLAICEGDDYWTDKDKLQKQIDFLENNPSYIATAHNCIVVDENSEVLDEKYPNCKENEYSFEHYIKGLLPGQSATIVMRNFYLEKDFDVSILYNRTKVLDRLVVFMLLCNGKIYSFQNSMSAYRHIKDHGSSYSATYKPDIDNKLKLLYCLVQYSENISNKEALHCAEYLYIKEVLYYFIKGKIKFREMVKWIRKTNRFFLPVIEVFYRVLIKKL